jgi:cytochrome c|tara:strand:- start:4683 stop:5123 length:441 start_codon:yes stop_codon:yes gene_type:complete
MKVFSFVVLLMGVFLMLFFKSSYETQETAYKTIQSIALKESIKRGNAVYSDFCISCHLPNGEGIQNIYPPLANSDYLKSNRRASIKGLKYGLKGEITVNGLQYNKYMPPMGLSADEIADVMNFSNHSWGNTYGKIVTVKEVSEIKK